MSADTKFYKVTEYECMDGTAYYKPNSEHEHYFRKYESATKFAHKEAEEIRHLFNGTTDFHSHDGIDELTVRAVGNEGRTVGIRAWVIEPFSFED